MSHSDFGAALVRALAETPHRISPKYFYDNRGSALFDQICTLPEYYPTRTELHILQTHAHEMAECMGAHADIVEFGAGASHKVRLLLDALKQPARYVPIDISGDYLQRAAQPLVRDYPQLAVTPVAADFTRPFVLPAALPGARRIGFFPGSTIGNFAPDEAAAFLRRAADLLRGGGLLLGVDLVKDPAVLHAAYNDAAGVTAEFNLNLLARANRELGTNFDLDGFAHYAPYQPQTRCIEMHLMSRRAQTVHLFGHRYGFAEGDSLHTESSYKYTLDDLRTLARTAGFAPRAVWCDPQQLFSVHWLQAPA